jgi:23S rRNA (uracil1939-C5)-methyltransferase
VLDAYAGVGTLTLPLARRAAAVLAVEAHPPAAEAAARNAARNGLANVAVQPGQVEDALAKHRGRVDLAVVDPPRRGCSPQALRALAALRPRRLAYVSCEPSTLARDVRLLDLLGYRLARACVIDLFPQTFHLETLALLEQG